MSTFRHLRVEARRRVAARGACADGERVAQRGPGEPDVSQIPQRLRHRGATPKEPVANAVEHARTSLTLSANLDAETLRIAVSDQCPHLPQVQMHDVKAARGRSLQMVAALAAGWGITITGWGKTVWTRILAPTPS
jgi:hypothetical protein